MAPDTDEDDSALPHSEDPSSSASDQGTCSSASPKVDAVQTLRTADTAEKHKLLFKAWDGDGDGVVLFAEFAAGMRKLRPTSEEIYLEVVADAAVKALPQLDTPENQRLDREEFQRFLERLTELMGKPFSIVSELLLVCGLELQPTGKADPALVREIKERSNSNLLQTGRVKALSEDPRIVALFRHFNKSGSGQLSFAELSHMLWRLRQDVTLRESRAEAVNTMLLLDTDSVRAVGVVEFTRFIQKLAVLLLMHAGVLAEAMLQIAEKSGEELPSLDDSAIAFSLESADPIAQMYETLADRKMHLLFELWDKDGDGHISFSELAMGLRKLCPTSEPVTNTASDAAEAMLVFDVDSDQNLNRAEFARFINHFCEGNETDFNTLSEFLILLAAFEDSPAEELAFLLSEDKVDRAISDLDASWKAGSLARSPKKSESRAEPAQIRQPSSQGHDAKPEGGADEGEADGGGHVSEAAFVGVSPLEAGFKAMTI